MQSWDVVPGSFFCPTLQQIGEAWWLSGLFSWDLHPICTVIMNEGSWLTSVQRRCNFDLSVSILNVSMLCEGLSCRKASCMSQRCSCRTVRILNSVVKWVPVGSPEPEWIETTHPIQSNWLCLCRICRGVLIFVGCYLVTRARCLGK